MKNKNWDELALSKFPNCWTLEGKTFVVDNPTIKDYILNIEFEKRKDFKKLNTKEQCKFISNFYNIIGEPAPILHRGDIDYFLFKKLIQW